MTETEKQALRDLKKATWEWLRENVDGCESRHPELDKTDKRIMGYVRGVVDNEAGHNLYEGLAVRRFFALLDRYGWDVWRVRNFVKFYESVKFSGTSGRQRYKMTPVQVFQTASIFGHKMPDGRRLIRTAYLFVPRKFSKTTYAAALAVHDILFGDSNAQAYVGANSYNQAKVCFDEIRAIMRGIDRSEKRFRINREVVFFKDGKRDSFARCLAASPKSLDGLNASLAILDEYAQARDTATKRGSELKNVLTTSMGVRKSPLTVVITTASDVLDGPCFKELEGAKAVLRGEMDNDMMFASLFMPDVDDREDDPATWAKVQPHLGVTCRPDSYAEQYAAAQLSADAMHDFRTKLLNVFAVRDVGTWFDHRIISQIVGGFNIDEYTGKQPCAVAFDLSVHDDFSAVAYTVWDAKQRMFLSHVDYYFPKGALKGHPNEQLYRMWVDAGHLRLCDGDKIDSRVIANDILRRAKALHIIAIGYDAYKAQELRNILANTGGSETLKPYSQTYGSFNLPVESFELLAYDNPPKIRMNDNPINTFCLGNCVIDEDNMGNKKPMKVAPNRKIDGVVCVLMTLGMMYTHKH
ncbi:MAG: terminase large subunit [Bacteroidales bacterium]|nr:terminase large subunit [Bacteroidales bacterium]MBR7051609.1 terminase large subunit [Bacteroidaceae bacterium]